MMKKANEIEIFNFKDYSKNYTSFVTRKLEKYGHWKIKMLEN